MLEGAEAEISACNPFACCRILLAQHHYHLQISEEVETSSAYPSPRMLVPKVWKKRARLRSHVQGVLVTYTPALAVMVLASRIRAGGSNRMQGSIQSYSSGTILGHLGGDIFYSGDSWMVEATTHHLAIYLIYKCCSRCTILPPNMTTQIQLRNYLKYLYNSSPSFEMTGARSSQVWVGALAVSQVLVR